MIRINKLKLLGISLVFPLTAQADIGPLHFHGFISQAALISDGNNFYGDSQHGSTDFFEAGISTTWQANNVFSLSGQILSRDAGRADNGSVKIDYLFADYKAVENPRSGMGFRLGRVRNSFGLYNETRDVIFSRSTIINPQAVYFEGNGLREILFATDGAQIYSYWDEEFHSTSFNLTYGAKKRLSQDVLENVTGGPSGIRKAEIENPVFAQILHSRDSGRSRYALSFVDATLRSTSTLPMLPETALETNGIVLSAERNWEAISLSGEYSYLDIKTYAGAIQLQDSASESVYLQSRYRFNPSLTATLRYEFSHTKDEQANKFSHSRHWVAGLQWLPRPEWILALDVYQMNGTGGVPGIDNIGRTLEKNTRIVAAMIGYRF